MKPRNFSGRRLLRIARALQRVGVVVGRYATPSKDIRFRIGAEARKDSPGAPV